MKKSMLLALAAISAMLVVPSFASATPAHVTPNPGNFSVSGGHSELKRVSGVTTTGTSTTGNGAFETTTTGWLELTFHGVKDSLGRTCTTAGQPSGTVVTTKLTFHLIMIAAHTPGILITPNHTTNQFAHFKCVGLFTSSEVTVTGNGIIGTITSPTCGVSSNKATIKFESSSPGNQKHLTWTGTTYDLHSTLDGGSVSTSSMDAEGTVEFGSSPKLECT